MTFADAYNALLAYAHRPSGDVAFLAQAKLEINAAVLWANRKYPFKYAEGLATVTYPASTEYIQLSSICDATILKLLDVQYLATATDAEGIPLRIYQYQEVQRMRLERQDLSPVYQQYPGTTLSYSGLQCFSTKVSHESAFYVVTIAGGFGLYPIPTAATYIKVHFNKQLPPLVADDDGNFLLDNCWDFILLKALKRFNIFLKTDERINITNEEIDNEWKAVLAWDSQIRQRQF